MKLDYKKTVAHLADARLHGALPTSHYSFWAMTLANAGAISPDCYEAFDCEAFTKTLFNELGTAALLDIAGIIHPWPKGLDVFSSKYYYEKALPDICNSFERYGAMRHASPGEDAGKVDDSGVDWWDLL